MLKDMTLEEFVQLVDSKEPAPGGGSVSALASGLGVALGRMVGNLTMSKKKYASLPEDVRANMEDRMAELETLRSCMLGLIDADTKAFQSMMEAYRLPKETIEEIKLRDLRIQDATIRGIETPKAVAERSLEALYLLDLFVEYGNSSAISDIGVGALLLHAGLEGALLNMKINLPSLTDKEKVAMYVRFIEETKQESEAISSSLLSSVHHKLNQSMV
ncbi:MAG: cyclodeaminase/cyclohydrolase family protein [Candidatus Izemoplasmatales bacterium]